ncbi:MAG: glycosyltransferase family 2 protein [Cyanophyceae cyanobacterium]
MSKVTIVVTPRERFSCTIRSLESLYQYTTIPFELIYVDGNSPSKVKRYLAKQAHQRKFHHLRTDYYLSPNRARNLGLKFVRTKYVVFVDNDVIVSPGWLSQLVQCAEETSATVVGPLMCQYEPVHEIVHFAGGESHIFRDVKGRRRLREKMYLQGKKVADVRDRLKRQETELAEFHCILVKTSIFERIGYLDEAMLNTKEHLDFCLQVRAAGEKIYFEPNCVVTYVPGPPLALTDLPYYMLRWSDAWVLNSLQRLREKWNLAEDSYFTRKYQGLGWRRRDSIIHPLTLALTFGRMNASLENLLTRIDKKFNRYLTDRYARKHLNGVKRS